MHQSLTCAHVGRRRDGVADDGDIDQHLARRWKEKIGVAGFTATHGTAPTAVGDGRRGCAPRVSVQVRRGSRRSTETVPPPEKTKGEKNSTSLAYSMLFASAPASASGAASTPRTAADLLRDLPRHRAAPPELAEPPATCVHRDSNNMAKVYLATHERTQPPANQVITTEKQNILLRQFHARADSKRAKRADETSLVEPAPKRRSAK